VSVRPEISPIASQTPQTSRAVVCSLAVLALGVQALALLALALLALALLALGVVAGCNIVAPAVMIVSGPPKTAAAYKLDPARATAVFLDDRDNRLPRRSMRLALTKKTQESLLASRVLEDQALISHESSAAFAGTESPDKPMSITELGRGVGADVVIHATVTGFGLSPDGQVYAPFAELRVRVVDAKSDRRLWPETEGGYPLSVQMPARAADGPSSVAARIQAETDLAVMAGRRLAELFYKHETNKPVSVPNP
jgi:hypothetical protein